MISTRIRFYAIQLTPMINRLLIILQSNKKVNTIIDELEY